ncbi:MAG: MazG family protein [Holophagaceae bacterium]|nr:MazG family protein [Holophagaceae bacterium]
MTALRDPLKGCPWDMKQDHQTLAEHLREEVAEALDALAAHEIGEPEKERHLCEELGDVWLQIAFHAQLAQERGAWDLHDVERMAVEKLVRRHPHVFADVQVAGAEDVLANWAVIKQGEKAALGQAPQKRLLDGIAQSLSPIDEAFEIGHRCAKVGFEWPDLDGVLDKVREEIEELQAESDMGRVEDEFGDVLFSLVQWARKKGLDPDRAMRRQLHRFKERFKAVEDMAITHGGWQVQSLETMETAWQSAKRSEIK